MGSAGGAISAGVPASPPGLQICSEMLPRALSGPGSECDNVPPMHRGSAEGRGVAGALLLAIVAAAALMAPAISAAATPRFTPRIRHAMGVEPAYGGAATPSNPSGIP